MMSRKLEFIPQKIYLLHLQHTTGSKNIHAHTKWEWIEDQLNKFYKNLFRNTLQFQM